MKDHGFNANYPFIIYDNNSIKFKKLIEKKRLRRRKPRPNIKRASNHIRPYDTKGQGIPRSRGALSKALEKYMSLAQDAFSNGDRIVAESYYQYAEHYQRVLNEIVEETKENSVQEFSGSEIRSNNNEKPSRTERALNAKNEKLEKISSGEASVKSEKSPNNQNNKKDFTSDGIEALKPFEI